MNNQFTHETLTEATPEQIVTWFEKVFKRHVRYGHAIQNIIIALEAHKRPVIYYWNVCWQRSKGYYQAEVNNTVIRHGKLCGGRQGFGYGDTPDIALMEAALDWHLQIKKRK